MQTDFSRALTLLSSFDFAVCMRSFVHAQWRDTIPLIVDCEQSLIFLCKVTARKTKARELR